MTIENEDGELKTYARYIGKATSNEGRVIYWIGASLINDPRNIFFETFEKAINYVKKHIKPEATMHDIQKF